MHYPQHIFVITSPYLHPPPQEWISIDQCETPILVAWSRSYAIRLTVTWNPPWPYLMFIFRLENSGHYVPFFLAPLEGFEDLWGMYYQVAFGHILLPQKMLDPRKLRALCALISSSSGGVWRSLGYVIIGVCGLWQHQVAFGHIKWPSATSSGLWPHQVPFSHIKWPSFT